MDKADGSVVWELQARSSVHLKRMNLFFSISCAEARKHPEKYTIVDSPGPGYPTGWCYSVTDTMDEVFPTRPGYEVAKAIKRNW